MGSLQPQRAASSLSDPGFTTLVCRMLVMANLQQMLKLMIDRGASDVFLTCGATPRIKIEGATHPVNAPVLQRGEVREMAYSIMNERQKTAFEESMEANLSYSFG